jgi:hypothetical protein
VLGGAATERLHLLVHEYTTFAVAVAASAASSIAGR